MIKSLLKTIVLILIILSIYFWRDDVANYINSWSKVTQEQTLDLIKNKNIESTKEAVLNEIQNVTETPGALQVYNKSNYLNFATRLTKQGIISKTNRERLNEGLPPLTENIKLDSSALIKVEDMMDLQYFEHVSPNGVGVSDLGNKVGYDFIIIGENLALGNFSDDQDIVDAWMASPGHRANILNKNYTEIGVSIGIGNFKDRKVWFAVQHFGTPKNLCPSIDQALKTEINSLQKKSSSMQKSLDLSLSKIQNGEVIEGKTANEQIADYNNAVNQYNDLVNSIKRYITTYNAQVNSFNNCIKEKQD